MVTASLPGLPARETDPDGIEIFACRRTLSWAGVSRCCIPFVDAGDLWAQDIDFAVIQTRMYPKASGQPASASGGASRRWSSTTLLAI